MRILVVEDDPGIAAQVGRALTDAGYTVDQASDGEEGDEFGRTLSLSGDLVAVGARNHDQSGQAYVFQEQVTGWTELARLTDRGVPVHYIVGNHDPWHLDYFERELGVTVSREAMEFRADGRALHLSHGDGRRDSRHVGIRRYIVRHPVSMALFRTLLPADVAYKLTRWTKNRFGSAGVDPQTVEQLADHGRRQIGKLAVDLEVQQPRPLHRESRRRAAVATREFRNGRAGLGGDGERQCDETRDRGPKQ